MILALMLSLGWANSAIVTGHKTKGSRQLGNVTLSSHHEGSNHMPSRYLKLKNFITQYSKKAGVRIATPNAKRRLFSNFIFY